jgi:hypothetical protein
MATGTAPKVPPARHHAAPVVQYIRRDITFADDGLTVTVGTLPAGSIILGPISGVYVTTVFDGNSSNVISIGASDDSGTNNLATAMSLGSVAFVTLDELGTATMLISSETKIVAAVTSTASAAAGVASIIIAFIEDNDL